MDSILTKTTESSPSSIKREPKKKRTKTLEGTNVQTDSTMLKEKMLCSANQVE
jgi:hypothetical protein